MLFFLAVAAFVLSGINLLQGHLSVAAVWILVAGVNSFYALRNSRHQQVVTGGGRDAAIKRAS